MNDFFSHALTPVLMTYVLSGMLALGLSQTVRQILEPLRNVRITISAIVANFIILPVVAAVTARVLGLDEGIRYGLVLFAMAVGAEAGPIFTAKAKGNVALSGGILVMSIAITIIYLPVMLGVLLPDIQFDVKKLVLKLMLTIVAPILLGLFIRARFEKAAHTAEKYMHVVSRLFVVLLLLTLVGLYHKQMLDLFGTRAIFAAVFFVAAGFAIGYLLGWPDRGTRLAMGFMHGGRNASAAAIAATSAFSDKPDVLMMIATTVTIMGVMFIAISALLKIKPNPLEPAKGT
jgi:BASS family bile acid:Na+ symporter